MALQHEIEPSFHAEALKAVAARLAGELRAMCDETEAAVLRELPAVAGHADATLRARMIEATFRRVLALMAGEAGPDTDPATHVAFGAAAARGGLPLETLTAGYRIGARIGWSHVRAAVRDLALPGDVVLALADAHVAYVDELAANSVEGYAREADAVRGERARERQALLDALLDGAGPDGDAAARAAARAAGWPWPERLAVAVLLARAPATAADRSVVLGAADRTPVAVAEPTRLSAWLEADGIAAAVGPAGPPAHAPTSLARARRLAGLAAAGIVPVEPGVLRWDDELLVLVVHGDPAAAAALAARRLGPLDDASPARTRLLRETLASWVANPGRPHAIARELHLHPQSVRYRLARLRDRLGDALDDPEARLEMALALRYAAAG
jgi:hypothetical protein